MKKYIISTCLSFILVLVGVIIVQNNIKDTQIKNPTPNYAEVSQFSTDQSSADSQQKQNVQQKNIHPTPSRHKVFDVPLNKEQQILIYNECKKYNLSPKMIIGIIQIESTFNPQAVSSNGSSIGLMQLNKNTYPWIAKQLGIKNFDPYNPDHNIKAGIWYIDHLKKYWESQGYNNKEVFNLALISYNMGVGNCKKYISKHGLNHHYVNKVSQCKDNLNTKE